MSGIAIFIIMVLIGASHDANAGTLTVNVVDTSREMSLTPDQIRLKSLVKEREIEQSIKGMR